MAETRTTTSHYAVQKVRRADWLQYWKDNQKTIVRVEDVEMVDTPRRMKRGVMVSADGDMPRLNLDANMHSIEPGVTSWVPRSSSPTSAPEIRSAVRSPRSAYSRSSPWT